jgi:histidyl-tRNA synthetase
MRDILPAEAELRDWMGGTILATYRRHGFRRVETPALENIQLLTGGEGGENEKLIFKVLKRGEKLDLSGAASEADLVDLGLRFDLTVPLARYYAHNHARLPKPLKAVQIGSVWRAERPQKGRFRQFTQCDIDILGVRSDVAEIELILATTEALGALGLEDLTVRINDRRILTAMARWCGFDEERHESLFIALDKWDKLEPGAIAEELRQAGHPAAAIQRVIERFTELKAGGDLEPLRAHLSGADAQDAIDGLKRIIEAVRTQAPVLFDATLVRGMSYYTGPIFEIQSSRFPSSIAGGGRYDKLIGKILGQDVPATGFSIGFERVVSILTELGSGPGLTEKRVALLFDEVSDDLPEVLRAARRLRSEGVSVSLEFRRKNSSRQLLELRDHDYAGYALLGGADGPEIHWFPGAER